MQALKGHPGPAWPKACLLLAAWAALHLPEAMNREASFTQNLICMRRWGWRGSGLRDTKTWKSQGDPPKTRAEQGGADITASEQASVRSSCHGPPKTRDRGLALRPEPSQHSRTNEAAPGPTTSSLTCYAPKSSPSHGPRGWDTEAQLWLSIEVTENLPEIQRLGAHSSWRAEAEGRAA